MLQYRNLALCESGKTNQCDNDANDNDEEPETGTEELNLFEGEEEPDQANDSRCGENPRNALERFGAIFLVRTVSHHHADHGADDDEEGKKAKEHPFKRRRHADRSEIEPKSPVNQWGEEIHIGAMVSETLVTVNSAPVVAPRLEFAALCTAAVRKHAVDRLRRHTK